MSSDKGNDMSGALAPGAAGAGNDDSLDYSYAYDGTGAGVRLQVLDAFCCLGCFRV